MISTQGINDKSLSSLTHSYSDNQKRSDYIVWNNEIKSISSLLSLLVIQTVSSICFEMNSRVPVKDCYDDKLGTFSFPVTISGISQNASCFEHCNCNGTAISWQSNFNCEWCCCQNRVLHKEIAPGRFFFYHLLASIIWFLIFAIFTVVSL